MVRERNKEKLQKTQWEETLVFRGVAVGIAFRGVALGIASKGAAVGIASKGAAVGIAFKGAAVGIALKGAAVGMASTGTAVGIAFAKGYQRVRKEYKVGNQRKLLEGIKAAHNHIL